MRHKAGGFSADGRNPSVGPWCGGSTPRRWGRCAPPPLPAPTVAEPPRSAWKQRDPCELFPYSLVNERVSTNFAKMRPYLFVSVEEGLHGRSPAGGDIINSHASGLDHAIINLSHFSPPKERFSVPVQPHRRQGQGRPHPILLCQR